MRSNKTSISFKLRGYLIDQNTNMKTKKNVLFSVVWFLKLRLNDTFLFTSKKLQTLILVIMMYKLSLSEKKSRKVEKKLCVHSTNNSKTASLSFFTIHICTSKSI